MGSFTIFIISLLCFGIGLVVGAYLFMQYSPEQKKARDIVKHLHEKQDEFKNYQFEVNQHFTETAQLLKQLSDSYRNLHNHTAKNADKLGAQNPLSPFIQSLPNTDSSVLPTIDLTNAAPPLDYAPRLTPYDKGTLNEEYGLEKVALTEQLIPNSNQTAKSI